MAPKQPPPAKGPQRRRKKGEARPPRRPMSSYNMFFRTEREKMKQSRQGSEIGSALTREIAQKWRVLTDEQRATYEEMAAKDKKRYAIEVVQWKQSQEAAPNHALTAAANAPEAWISTTTNNRPHPFANSRGPQHQSLQPHNNDEHAMFAQDLSDTSEEKQPYVERNNMELPELPMRIRRSPFQAQVGMNTQQANEIVGYLQRLQSQSQDVLQGMAVFPETPGSPFSAQSYPGLQLQRFDYQREVRRVANELGDDGVDLVICLFRNAN